MDGWTIIRFLHVLAMAFFVGGQLVLAAAVVPAVRRAGGAAEAAMRPVARRFGIGSAIALAVLIATGAALAGHYHRWGEGTLHLKLGLLGLVFLLLVGHIVIPKRAALAAAVGGVSVIIALLGVELAHG
jgi:uncharacterized membrane protein